MFYRKTWITNMKFQTVGERERKQTKSKNEKNKNNEPKYSEGDFDIKYSTNLRFHLRHAVHTLTHAECGFPITCVFVPRSSSFPVHASTSVCVCVFVCARLCCWVPTVCAAFVVRLCVYMLDDCCAFTVHSPNGICACMCNRRRISNWRMLTTQLISTFLLLMNVRIYVCRTISSVMENMKHIHAYESTETSVSIVLTHMWTNEYINTHTHTKTRKRRVDREHFRAKPASHTTPWTHTSTHSYTYTHIDWVRERFRKFKFRGLREHRATLKLLFFVESLASCYS